MMMHEDGLYFEDLEPQKTFVAGPVEVSEAEIVAFAERYDPQPFHTLPDRAPPLFFGGHVASGWHTAGLTMRMFVTCFRPAWGLVGAEVKAMRWPRAVAAGDRLFLRAEVLSMTPSRSRPDRGIVEMALLTTNQHGQAVQEATPVVVVPRRPS